MHGARCRANFAFHASTLALQRVFVFRTDGRMDTMCENNDHWWVNMQFKHSFEFDSSAIYSYSKLIFLVIH